MRVVAVLSLAFVVLVGVVAVTYPNESDEVRQRNAAFMKLGDIKGEVKADPEQETASVLNNPVSCTKSFMDTTAKNKAAMELKRDPLFRATLACLCQDLNQISRIAERLDPKTPVSTRLRVAVERARNNLAAGIRTTGGGYAYQDSSDEDFVSDMDNNDVILCNGLILDTDTNDVGQGTK